MNILCSQKGSMYIMVLSVIGIILIIGSAWMFVSVTDVKQADIIKKGFEARMLSAAGIELAVKRVKDLFSLPLITEEKEVNMKKLELLDPEKAKEFKLQFTDNSVTPEGKISVSLYLKNFNRTKFFSQIMTEDQIPDDLNRYRKTQGEDGSFTAGDGILGGWEAEMVITSKGSYRGEEDTKTVTRGIKVFDVTPPASEYTLFIYGDKEEYLRKGRFVLSNWRFESKLSKVLIELVGGLLNQAIKSIPNSPASDLNQMITLVKNFVTSVNDAKQKKAANELIMTLHPWGRVRTNGKLHVYLPFFEVDDIINYFVDNKYYQRPEVGYIGCYNMLHDRYMAKYTRYEGDIIKYYYELAPYVLQKQYPREKHSKYTRFSTRPYYVEENPSEKMPDKLDNYTINGRKYSSNVYPEGKKIFGTRDMPFFVEGIVYVEGELHIGGYLRGKAVIIAEGDVFIENDIKRADEKTLITIITPKGKFKSKRPDLSLECSLCAKSSISGGKKLTITGNFVTEYLNREKTGGETEMPDITEIKYNPDIRGRIADHIVVAISRANLTEK